MVYNIIGQIVSTFLGSDRPGALAMLCDRST
jgi:hypothetical protein